MRSRKSAAGSLFMTCLALCCVACSGSDGGGGGGAGASDTVTVPNVGTLKGTTAATMRSFKGIPYAAPPTGPLRWKPPQKAAALTGTYDATDFRSGCAQPQSFFGTQSASEDCLYLNVYTPTDAGPHPVMVWIHGGAFLYGESTGYDPSPLVAQGVVVVTINYRLGMLGFLAHPALDAGPGAPSTNFGLLDQQLALHWVQDNIESFGGDKTNVTIFGESAGGFSVLSQLVMPGAHGLFHKAIVESGAYGSTLQPALDAARTQAATFATGAHCPDPCTADFLRGLSAADVLTAQNGMQLQTILPPVDGTVVPTGGVGAAIASGAFEKVPVLLGSNHDEWSLFVGAYLNQTNTKLSTQADYEAAAAATFGVPATTAGALIANYPLSSYSMNPNLALTAAGTDFVFACPNRAAAGQLSAAVPTYAYEFKDPNAPERFLPVPPADPSFQYHAAHASELQYLFTLAGPAVAGTPLSADQQALAATMVKYWTQFAKTGNPADAASPAWPAYTAASDTVLTLDTPAASVQPTTGFKADHKCN